MKKSVVFLLSCLREQSAARTLKIEQQRDKASRAERHEECEVLDNS